MKKSLILLLLLLSVAPIFSKRISYPVINTKVTGILSEELYSDYDKINRIYEKEYEKDGNKTYELTQADLSYLESMKKKYHVNQLEYDIKGWTVYPMGCSWYCGSDYETSVSSSLAASYGNKYGVDELRDDDTRTAWVEGVSGYGVGESISFTFNYDAPRATSVNLVNGYAKNKTTWKNNSRVKKFIIYDDAKVVGIVNLLDTMAWQSFELPYPFPNRPYDHKGHNEERSTKLVTFKFVIYDVYEGDKYDDTAISAIMFDGIDVHCVIEGSQITMADGGLKKIEDIKEGDIVQTLGKLQASPEIAQTKVKRLHKAKHKEMIRLTLENGMQITLTPDHPLAIPSHTDAFRADNANYRDNKPSEYVSKYKIGSLLYVYENGKFTHSVIKNIETLNNENYKAYSLELDDENAFFIVNGIASGQE